MYTYRDTGACTHIKIILIHTDMLTQRDTNTMHNAHSHSHTPLQELLHSPGSPSQDLCLDEDPAAQSLLQVARVHQD